MFRNKLLLAFSLLGLASILQAAVATFALKTANDNIQRGRLANELYAGFVELLSQKHQLRLELTNALVGINDDPQQRQVFYAEMLRTLSTLDTLVEQAKALDKGDPSKAPEHQQRLDSLQLLKRGVLQVGEAMRTEAYEKQAASPQDMQFLLTDIFDIADEKDLRATLLQSISRERLATARDRAAADVSLSFMNKLMIAATGTLVLFVLFLAYYFYSALTHPIEMLVKGASALRRGNLAYRIPEAGHDEFAELAKSMNSMTSEIAQSRHKDSQTKSELEAQVKERTRDYQEALHRLEKLELRRKQMFADISHELRTPTTAIRGEAEIALRYNTSDLEDYRTTLKKVVDYSHALSRVIDDVLTLARSDIDAFVLDKCPIDFAVLCKQLVDSSCVVANGQNTIIEQGDIPAGWVLGDAQRLEQVLRIGLENALCYTPPKGKIEINADISCGDHDKPYYSVRMRNEGQGIAKQELARIFDRHFRGRYAQAVRPEGSGLGLPLARTIVRSHNGTITIDSVENEYTEFIVSLPLLETTDATNDDPSSPE